MHGRGRLVALVGAVLATAALPAVAQAQVPGLPGTPNQSLVQPYGFGTFQNSFSDVLPPGTNGFSNTLELGAFLSQGTRPRHNDDQFKLYEDLVYASPGLDAADLRKYFKDSTFGVKPEDVERTYSPRNDVTIVRDQGYGVPHVYGQTREGAMFGLGYIAAEDRLFFIDVLRNYGRAQLATFAGGANIETDAEQWQSAPYTEAEYQAQIDRFDDFYGAEGAVIQNDLAAYTAGINKYIDEAKLDPRKLPGEYGAILKPEGPDPWKQTDIIATASLVAGIFGKGGGSELQWGQILQTFRKRFGTRRGNRFFRDFRAQNDPEAPTTVHSKAFPYQTPPRRVAPGSVALPDAGSLVNVKPLPSGGGAAASGADSPLRRLFALPSGNSNALVVSARESVSGKPLAVFGPQTGYFSPNILMEQDVHAPTIDARGSAFPGVNLYVQLGHGPDYSWSATSAGQDIVDVFAVELCNRAGGAVSRTSTDYMLRGKCTPMDVMTKEVSWTPSAADQTPPGSATLRAERTKYGIVTARALIKGKPYAYTSLRSTYQHEVDSAIGFADFNNPAKMRNVQDFQRAAHKIGFTFNWLYVDDKDVGYFNSGNNPVRAPNTDQVLPVFSKFEWKNWNPDLNTAAYTPFSQHPQVINQSFITSWNNKQAKAYGASDSGYTPLYRSQFLDSRVQAGIRGANKMTLVQLIDAMEDAATVDGRGDKMLSVVLDTIGKPRNAALQPTVNLLRQWVRNGAHRRDKDKSGTYDEAEAVRIMDAWYPQLVGGIFEPVLGTDLYKQVQGRLGLDNDPNNHGDHLGSAYNGGWYGFVHKDLRTLLGRPVRGRYGRIYCGRGNLARCRATLESTLLAATKVTAEALYGGDSVCKGTERRGMDLQRCFDAIRFRPLGGVTQPLAAWQNRPTYQQVVEIQGHRPR